MALIPTERHAIVRELLIQALLAGQPPQVARILTRNMDQEQRWFNKIAHAKRLISRLEEEWRDLYNDLSLRAQGKGDEARITQRAEKITEILLDLHFVFDEIVTYLQPRTDTPPSS